MRAVSELKEMERMSVEKRIRASAALPEAVRRAQGDAAELIRERGREQVFVVRDYDGHTTVVNVTRRSLISLAKHLLRGNVVETILDSPDELKDMLQGDPTKRELLEWIKEHGPVGRAHGGLIEFEDVECTLRYNPFI